MTTQSEQKKTDSVFSRYKKTIIAVGLLIILSVLALVVIRYLEPMAEKQLLAMVNSEFAPNAEIEIAEFSLGLIPPRITIEGIKLVHAEPFGEQTPEKPLDNIRHLEISRAELSGIDLFRLVRGKEWGLGTFTIEQFDIELVPASEDRLTDSAPLEQPLAVTVSQINISDATFRLYPDRKSDTFRYSADGINLEIDNFSITDPNQPIHTYFEDFKFSVNSAKHIFDNGHYHLRADDFLANSRDKIISLNYFEALPQYSSYEMAEEAGKQLDTYTVKGGPFSLQEVQIKQWFETEDILIGFAEFHDLDLLIDRERSFDREPRDERTLLHHRLINFPFRIHADSLKWHNSKVSYTERFTDQDRSGTILFNSIDLFIDNLQNSSPENAIHAFASARFMDAADLEINFEFNLDDLATHTIRGTLSEMDLNDVNDPLENLAGIRIRDGFVNSLDFTFTADDYRSDGELQMIYNDLSLRLLDDETFAENRGTRFRSFFVNAFAVRSSNETSSPRMGTIDFEREKERSTFNYWWKSIRSGLEDTVRR